jgi:TonB family protein
MNFPQRTLLQLAVAGLITFTSPFISQADQKIDRERAARKWVDEIQKAELHKIYVADFLNLSNKREFGGCYFASIFATNIAEQAKGFEVVNRIDAQRILAGLGRSAENLQSPEAVAKVANALHVDGMLLGTIIVADNKVKITLSLRSAPTNQEIQTSQYQEPLQSDISGNWPPSGVPSPEVIYFSGLDGVSIPKCIECPNPSYTQEARAAHFQGVVVTSVLLTTEGKVGELRVIHDPKHGLAERCVEVIRKWRLKPAMDSRGNPVPVYVPIETSFQLF